MQKMLTDGPVFGCFDAVLGTISQKVTIYYTMLMFIAPATFGSDSPEEYNKSCQKAIFGDRSGESGQLYDGAVF